MLMEFMTDVDWRITHCVRHVPCAEFAPKADRDAADARNQVRPNLQTLTIPMRLWSPVLDAATVITL